MTSAKSNPWLLNYGDAGRFTIERDARQTIVADVPEAIPHLRDVLRASLEQPLDFPPLAQAVIPGDRVTIALDRGTPQAAELIAAIWDVLESRSVVAEDVRIIQPGPRSNDDPRAALDPGVREQVGWRIHDRTARGDVNYLAATAAGERVYLAREVVEADVVLSVGSIAYDPVIGCRGTNSVFFPGLSTADAVEKTQGQGHSELGPEDDRPLRQMIDEIGWLLGTQFSLQVIAAAGGGVANVLAGASESVMQHGRRLLAKQWLIEIENRPEIVVVGIDHDAGGHGWEQVGAALDVARNLVARGGKIVVLTELSAELGPGMELIRASDSPRDAIRPLRKSTPSDLIAATQFASAADWARIYLLSRLDSDLVEDLFCVPLGTEREIERLLSGGDPCLIVPSAQHAYGRVRRA